MIQKNRIATLALLLLFVVAAAIGGWMAGTTIQSPAEAAARTAPPTPAPILVPVEQRLLTSKIVTRGTARYGLPQPITIAPSTLKNQIGVITTLPTHGAQLQEGDLLLTASERPVFVLQGETPVYRDLVPGLTGDDVAQFEASLQRLGFDPGPLDGRYDEQTSAAVAAWYAAAGWEPFPPTSAQLAQLQALEKALAQALNEKASAADVAATAPLVVAAASAQAESANKLAAITVATKRAVRDQLRNAADADAVAHVTANAELEAAEVMAKAAQLEGEVAIQNAINAQKSAERAAQLAAETAAQIATDLDAVKRKNGVQMPADELVFIPFLPVRVEATNIAVGDAASGPVLVVTNNQLAIDSLLPLDEAPLVKPGMAVAIDEPDLGIQATGVVVRVASAPGTDGVDGFHIYFETQVDETPTALAGYSLRLTIPVQSTDGAVIVAPISALSLKADGTSIVQVEKNGAFEMVVVEPGLAADGFVEVTPQSGTLEPGQLVVIGYENQD